MSRSATLAVSRGCGGVKKFFRINSRIITPAAKRRGRVQNGPSDLVPQASRSHLRLRRGGRSEKGCLHRCAARTSQQRCKATVSPDCDLPYESGANNGSSGGHYSEVKGAPKLTESRRRNAARRGGGEARAAISSSPPGHASYVYWYWWTGVTLTKPRPVRLLRSSTSTESAVYTSSAVCVLSLAACVRAH